MISAVVLTKNEEANIERCLNSLSWCDEIVIVDDYSEDGTEIRIKNYEARIKDKKIKIYKRHLNENFAAQRNFGLEKAKGDWVLFIDSDEVVTNTLKKEILFEMTQGNYVGYFTKRDDYFLGKWLKYGETGNIKLLRLAKRNAGGWRGRVHEKWEIKGKIGILANPLLHYPHKSISQFLKEVNWYTDLVVQCWREEGRLVGAFEIIIHPLGKFIQNYVLKLGFLDGVPGVIMAIMMSFHSFLARSKLWLLRNR